MKSSIRKRRRERHKNHPQSFTSKTATFKLNLVGIDAKLIFISQKSIENLRQVGAVVAKNIERSLSQFFESISYVELERSLNPCAFNSGSIYLKCAINPKGDCNSCEDYKKRE